MNLPYGTREMRIWFSGWGFHMFRVVETAGDVSGELIYTWDARPDLHEKEGETHHDLMLYNLAGKCEDFSVVAGQATCRALFALQPDWRDTLRRAEQAGLWRLSDSSALPGDGTVSADGWALTVELHDGVNYRAYHYGNPEHRPSWPEATQAIEIASAFREIEALVRPGDLESVYRGITNGEYGAAFHLCDTEIVWGVRFSLEEIAGKVGLAIPKPGPYGYLLEAFGRPTPAWVAREWGSRYEQDLTTYELVSITPAYNPACEQ